jgi:DNA modification methylase
METVPCKVLPADTPVAKLREYAIKDNNGFGEDDWDVLANEWDTQELQEWGMELPMDWDVDGQGDATASEDDFDESEVTETICKRGEVWKLGEHRLMCGDSTNADDVARLMDGERAELLFTSPPYSDLREYNGGKDLDPYHLSNFIGVYAVYSNFQCVNLGLQKRDNEIFPYWNAYIDNAHKAGLKLLAWNVWDKMTCGSIGMQKYFIPCRHEWIFVFGVEPKEINRTWEKDEASLKRSATTTARRPDGKCVTTTAGDVSHKLKRMESCLQLWCETGKIREEHPAVFPVGLPSEYINALTNENDIVVEPFGGSGTTIIAAEQLNRKCRMMELDPHYCDVIIARWEKLTGQKAERISDG